MSFIVTSHCVGEPHSCVRLMFYYCSSYGMANQCTTILSYFMPTEYSTSRSLSSCLTQALLRPSAMTFSVNTIKISPLPKSELQLGFDDHVHTRLIQKSSGSWC